MSLFMCAHGELYSKCKYCFEFEKQEYEEPEHKEDDPVLSKIVTMMRKEKIEY